MKKKQQKSKTINPEFDNCPICQAMKKAEEEGKELSLEELKEAFQEAGNQGAIVGGNLLDDNPTN